MLYHSQCERKVENNNKINDVSPKKVSMRAFQSYIILSRRLPFLLDAQCEEEFPLKWIFMQKHKMSLGNRKIKYIGVWNNKKRT